MLYSSQAKKGVAERLERGGFVTDNRYREIPVANEIARLLLWQELPREESFSFLHKGSSSHARKLLVVVRQEGESVWKKREENRK